MWSLNFFKVITGSTFSAKVAFVAYRNRSFGPWTLLTDSIRAIGSINSHYFHITGDRQYKEFRPQHIYTFIIYIYIYMYGPAGEYPNAFPRNCGPRNVWLIEDLYDQTLVATFGPSVFFGAEISCKTAPWKSKPSSWECWFVKSTNILRSGWYVYIYHI